MLQRRIRLRGPAVAGAPPRHSRQLEGRGPTMGAIMTSHLALRDEFFQPVTLPGLDTLPDEAEPAAHNRTALAGATVDDGEDGAMKPERPSAEQWSRVKTRLRTELGEDVFTSWFARV